MTKGRAVTFRKVSDLEDSVKNSYIATRVDAYTACRGISLSISLIDLT
jgi:hypothetical protein